MHLFIYLFIYSFIYLSVHFCICIHVSLSICLAICYMNMQIHISVGNNLRAFMQHIVTKNIYICTYKYTSMIFLLRGCQSCLFPSMWKISAPLQSNSLLDKAQETAHLLKWTENDEIIQTYYLQTIHYSLTLLPVKQTACWNIIDVSSQFSATGGVQDTQIKLSLLT